MEYVALKETFYGRNIVKAGSNVSRQENLAKLYPSVFKPKEGKTTTNSNYSQGNTDNK